MSSSTIEYIDAFLTDDEIDNISKDDMQLTARLDKARVQRLQHVIEKHSILMKGPVVAHLKGFGSGIDWVDDRFFEYMYKKLLNLIDTNGICTVVWDGDDYQNDSFTHILPLLKSDRPNIQLVACLQEHEKHNRWQNSNGFHGSWKDQLPGKTVVLLVDRYVVKDDHYENLGILALAATSSKTVYTFLGGLTVLQELLNVTSTVNDMRFILFNVNRTSKNGEKIISSLYGHDRLFQTHSFPDDNI
jgi:hypothetical protein